MADKDKKIISEKEAENKHKPADEEDIDLYKRYIKGPYTEKLNTLDTDIDKLVKNINSICGVREAETGVALPSNWVIDADRKALGEDSLMVGRLTKIIEETDPPKKKYVTHIRQQAKYIVDLDPDLSPNDVEEGMRVGT